MRTFDDLEREAYIRGDIQLADIYGRLSEFEHYENEIERLKDEIDDLQFNHAVLIDLEDDIEYWRKRATEAEGKLEETQFILESLSK